MNFNIAADGKASGISATDEQADPPSSALIAAALAQSTFSAPPDGMDHAISVKDRVVGGGAPRG